MNREKPVVLFDGACEFCRRWVARCSGLTENRVVYRPYQEALQDFPQLSEKECERAVQLIETNGKIYSAAPAALRTLKYTKRWGWLYEVYKKSKTFARIADVLYKKVTENR